MFFGKNLRHLRIKKGIVDQVTLGNTIGITRSAVSSYEEVRAEPKFDTLTKIADYFNVTIDELLRKNLSK